MNEEHAAESTPTTEASTPPAKAICAITLVVMPGAQGVQIRTAQPGGEFERAATALDIRGACTEVLQMLAGQMTANQLVQLQAQIEQQAQADAAIQAELAAAASKRGGNGHVFPFGKRR